MLHRLLCAERETTNVQWDGQVQQLSQLTLPRVHSTVMQQLILILQEGVVIGGEFRLLSFQVHCYVVEPIP